MAQMIREGSKRYASIAIGAIIDTVENRIRQIGAEGTNDLVPVTVNELKLLISTARRGLRK